jgi:Na+-translocating ferredoxin:NAD+ oxidoreductase RnfD subunit
MISDPRTAPNHAVARIVWAILIAAVAFYLSAFKWMNSTPIYVLVLMAPLVPLLDYLIQAKKFEWKKTFHTTIQRLQS